MQIKLQGFTLVEIAITLVIISLIIAAITSGAHLMQGAKLNKIAVEISNHVSAVEKFKDEYKYYPGDMPNAESFWGTYNITTNPDGTINGNGDEKIINLTQIYPTNLLTEPLRAWQQLALAGFLSNSFSGVASSPDYVADVNLPKSIIEGAHYYLYNFSTASDISGNTQVYSIFGTSGNALQLGSNNSSTRPFGSAILAEDAKIVDKKIDDGEPDSGKVFVLRGNDYKGVANRCVDGDYTAASVNFVLLDTIVSCRLVYWLSKDFE